MENFSPAPRISEDEFAQPRSQTIFVYFQETGPVHARYVRCRVILISL